MDDQRKRELSQDPLDPLQSSGEIEGLDQEGQDTAGRDESNGETREDVGQVGDNISVGNISNSQAVAIGRGAFASFVQIVKQPAQWQDTVFSFFSAHRYYLFVLAALLIALFVLYWVFKDLYLISWWWYVLGAVLLVAATWAFYSSYPPKQINLRISIGSLCTLSLLAILGWHSWHIVNPREFDPQVFGIALAEVFEGGSGHRTSKTRELTDQVYERFCQDLEHEFGRGQDVGPCVNSFEGPDLRRVAVQRIGVIPDSKTAKEFGRRINADVVIWGRMLTSEKGGTTLGFEVLETLDKAVNPDFRVIMPVTTTSTELLGVERDLSGDPVEVKEVTTQQAIVISSYILGLIAYLDRDFPEAVEQLEKAVDTIEESSLLEVSNDGRALILYYLARSYHALSQVDQGQQLLLTAKEANPNEPAILISLALGYGSIGPKEYLNKYLELALEKLNAWLIKHPEDSNALFDRGLVYEIDRRYPQAAFNYEKLLENDLGFYTAYIQLGLVTYELGRFDDAEEWFKKGIALAEETGTNPSTAYTRLGEIYEKSGRMALANEAYQKAVKLDPEEEGILHYYAKFLESQGEMEAAADTYAQMVVVSHLPGWAYGELASFYRRRGLLDEAILNYQHAIGAGDANALLYTYLAETFFERGDIDNAKREYEKVVALNEENGIYYVYSSYAGFLFNTGSFSEAADMYQRAIELRPVNYPSLMNLGQTLEILGETYQAALVYCQVIDYDDVFSVEQIQLAVERLGNLGPAYTCP